MGGERTGVGMERLDGATEIEEEVEEEVEAGGGKK